MGLQIATVRFDAALPSFQTISQQYTQQTGLDLRLLAIIHLAKDGLENVLESPTALLTLLQADATTVAEIDARYEAAKAPLIRTNQFEKAALLRDQMWQEKQRLHHISQLEIAVGHGDFYSIDISIEGDAITVHRYYNQYYAVVSFIKTLVDLGGKYLDANSEQPLTLPISWQKLKQWQGYKWYNRPRK